MKREGLLSVIHFLESSFSLFLICRKAIKYYMQDLCYKPDRLDSWAGMALARMSRMDVKLASVSKAVLLSLVFS